MFLRSLLRLQERLPTAPYTQRTSLLAGRVAITEQKKTKPVLMKTREIRVQVANIGEGQASYLTAVALDLLVTRDVVQ